jgi:hypothetical protein
MESPEDTCAVAAALVGLTEKLIPDLDALAGILSGHGFDHQHVGSTIRALQDYAALLNLPHSQPSHATATPIGKWWRRLFE